MPPSNDYKNTIKVYNQLGKKYIADTKKVIPVEREDFSRLIIKKGLVLDVGCAGGRDTAFFIKKGFKVVGIDMTDVFLQEAKKYIRAAKFIKMDVRKLKFSKNYFDAIWAHAVLLHIKKIDIPTVLTKFYSILKPGGMVRIRVKRGKGEVVVKEKLSQGKERMFTFFFKKELEKFVKQAGFKIVRSELIEDELKRKDVKWITLWARKPVLLRDKML